MGHARLHHGTMGDGERFYERALLEREAIGQPEKRRFVHRRELGEPAMAVTGKPTPSRAVVVLASLTIFATAVVRKALHRHLVTRRKPLDTFSHFRHHTGHFVPLRVRVRLVPLAEIVVQIAPTDPRALCVHNHIAWGWRNRVGIF